ncbi:hypothetical protein CNMCM5623_004786 [Aspergillus felis]|uniref:Uncharacterized protein n=1 Tax=Aspergillus felis TaxID=1287682 RepID=A0A8H6UZN3_9EURO|nr:hypothetical protein CNMCM5623_004786 [Aspergillus felis]
MTPPTRTTSFDARLVRGLIGTTVTTYDLVSDGASPESTSRTARCQNGPRSPQTVGKFLCHLDEDPKQIALMRVYQQIPITGTEDADHDTLARQAVPPGVCGELESYTLLQSGGCSAVPRFLGHAERIQGERDLLPGGYVRYLVWEKVPGEPLTEGFFWGLDDSAREDIRSKFRAVYK